MRALVLLCLNALLCVATSDDLTRSGRSEQPRDQAFLNDIELPGRPEIEPFHRPSPAPLKCFQVAQPVLGPSGPVYQNGDDHHSDEPNPACSMVLMRHTFGFSYGKPYVGDYLPPDCEFDRVIMNFTVTSAGRQFDRLALMFFNDTEVWRTSTAEPKPEPGIAWTYWKDMTQYLSLWKSPQKLIFDLGNLIDDKYTGSFDCILTATFFVSDVEGTNSDQKPADMVIPVSAGRAAANASSAWTVPRQRASSTVGFPRNARRAVFSISANGQQAEEFWWSNVLQSDAGVFNATAGRLPGLSPFREVQLYVDDHLAGVYWPFPVVFTGGVSPGLHRPIVGLEAFDLLEHEIDVTPWLPLLCNGDDHTFSLQVVGLYDDGKTGTLTERVGQYWVVTGKIFVWLGEEEDSITRGRMPEVESSEPVIAFGHETRQDKSGITEALKYTLNVQRTISVRGQVLTREGSERDEQPSWSQTLAYSNVGSLTSYGTNQVNAMNISGIDRATGSSSYFSRYSYPLYANQSFTIDMAGNLTLEARLDQGLEVETHGETVFPSGVEAFGSSSSSSSSASAGVGTQHKASNFTGSRLSTTKVGEAVFHQSGDKKSSSGFGWSKQRFTFSGLRTGSRDGSRAESGSAEEVQLYFRNVSAANDSVVYDREVLADGRQNLLYVAEPSSSGNDEEADDRAHEYFAPVRNGHTVMLPTFGGDYGYDGADQGVL